MTHTYDDPIKRESRVKIREFISRHLDDYSKLNIACFPGAEVEGQEGLEIREIYDPLNISRSNITGIERLKRRANKLEDANLGINIEPNIDYTFFRNTPRRFHILNLDYSSYFGDPQRFSLDIITAKSLLHSPGILITNYYGAREQKETLDEIMRIAETAEANYNVTDCIEALISEAELNENKISLSKTKRSIGIQTSIASSLLLGKATLNPQILFPDNAPITFSEAEKLLFEQVSQSNIKGEGFTEKLARYPLYRSLNLGSLIQSLKQEPELKKELEKTFKRLNSYLVKDHESYSYVSNTGAPMYLDCWLVDHYENNLLTESAYESKDKIVIPRTFLGSSFRPTTKSDKINKEEAINLLKCGISTKDIVKSYPTSFTKGQLSAIQAHITMGTYDK